MMENKGSRVRIGGQDFIRIDRADLPSSENVPLGAVLLIPCQEPDDQRDVPSARPKQDAISILSSGNAAYRHIGDWDRADQHLLQFVDDHHSLRKQNEEGVRACQLKVFSEENWSRECFSVMHANGWLERGGELAEHIVQHVLDHYGQQTLDEARERYGTKWTEYVAELAAVRLTKPLSRLWYSVNMRALYFIHHDHLRLGYLWAQYRILLSHETECRQGTEKLAGDRDAGAQSAKQIRERSKEILDRMMALVQEGSTVSDAARLAAKAGLGTSAGANRKLWGRRASIRL